MQKIVHLMGPKGISNTVDRLRGYREALEKWHIPYRQELIQEGGLTFHDGEIAALQLLEAKVEFDAVHAFTEMSLIGAKSVFQSRGLRIPQDIKIACLSGTNISKMVYPKITAVEQDAEGLAREAAGIMLDLIAGQKVECKPIYLAAHRIDRESSLK